MKFEFKMDSDDRSPAQVFRKWTLIGAVAGVIVVVATGGFILAAIMVVGAFFGAIIGAVIGAVNAAIAAVR